MTKKESVPKRSARKTVARGLSAATRAAKASAKAVLMTDRTLPPPVEIEPRPFHMSALRSLEQERERLLDELRRQEVLAQDHPTTGNHMADDATEVSEQAKAMALRSHLEGMIKEIDRAIVRAQRGTYGVCESCGKPISEDRLKVVPSATQCIECAKRQIHTLKVAA
ncbi:MAG: TraR/DksA C4-type zinc finger protein [Chloroflexi bacterium]|nr:TraR/DksA C4-type zinc finger protein [Chloroflexota bacterium]